MNRLDLESLSGSVIKQLDQSPLKYKLIDVDGKDYSGLPAEVVLINRGEEALRKTVEVKDNEFELTIDKVLPQASYTLEVVVDDKYIFPSDYSTKIWVNVSTVGQVIDQLEKIGYDEILEKLKADLALTEVVAYDDSELRRLIEEHHHDDRYAKIDHEHEEYLTQEDLEGLNLTGNDPHKLEAMVLSFRKSIPNGAYADIPLTEYDFTGVEHIGRSAFSNTSLTGDLVLPDTLLSLGSHAFSSSQLTSVSFQGELTEIPMMAFMRNSITFIEFPEGLKFIGVAAFESNPLEGELRIPETVETISANAFYDTKLTKVYVPEKTQYTTGLLEGSFPPGTEIIRY